MFRKLAFIRQPGFGNRAWDSPRYITPGVSRSFSVYDLPTVAAPTNVTHWTPNGTFDPNPQAARLAHEGAMFNSAPNALYFQGFANLNWSAGAMRPILMPGALQQNFNPNVVGSKEQQRATVYEPWPSAGAIFPKSL